MERISNYGKTKRTVIIIFQKVILVVCQKAIKSDKIKLIRHLTKLQTPNLYALTNDLIEKQINKRSKMQLQCFIKQILTFNIIKNAVKLTK
jgi:hypothetical protein